jgi:hypothetical protein
MYRRFHVAALAATAVISFIVVAPVPADDGESPSFWVESADLDLETVLAGSVVTATFIFHNDGPEDVHIIRAKPS